MSDSNSASMEHKSSLLRGDPDEVERRPQRVLDIEQESLRHLMSLIKKLAPHMKESVVLKERWWEENRFLPGIHVSLALIGSFITYRR